MKIIKTDDIGFCFGVKRAIKKAEQALDNIPANNIFMLGEIIHNPQVIDKFKKKGVTIVKEITDVPPGKHLITRAHGILKKEEEYAKMNGIVLINTTCPYVKKLHQIANILNEEGYQIIVFGDIGHPEIKSLLSYIDDNAQVIQSEKNIKEEHFKFFKKVGLISQTTKDIKQYKNIVKNIFNHTEELRIFNTICKATILRQEKTKELARDVDLMVVIGGLNSANTNRLASLCKNIGVETFHVEDETQLNLNWFKNKEKIGITSGTSTPDNITNDIIKAIQRIRQGFKE